MFTDAGFTDMVSANNPNNFGTFVGYSNDLFKSKDVNSMSRLDGIFTIGDMFTTPLFPTIDET
jgi:hypothetical protein